MNQEPHRAVIVYLLAFGWGACVGLAFARLYGEPLLWGAAVAIVGISWILNWKWDPSWRPGRPVSWAARDTLTANSSLAAGMLWAHVWALIIADRPPDGLTVGLLGGMTAMVGMALWKRHRPDSRPESE